MNWKPTKTKEDYVPRRPHGKYVKPKPKGNIVLTPRDKKIIYTVYLRRLVSSEQLYRVTNSTCSNSAFNDRLRDLWAHDYLDRPDFQRTLFSHENKRPTVHALGQKGAEWLVDNDLALVSERVGWKARNAKLHNQSEFVFHKLGEADCMIRIEQDFANAENLRFVNRDELWFTSPDFNPKESNPQALPTTLHWFNNEQVKRDTIPDDTFGFIDSRGDVATKGLLFLEYDRGTEPLVRNTPRQSSILQKNVGYADVYQRKLHTQKYGYKMFRVLTVTEQGQDRVDGMIDVYQSRIDPQRLPAGAVLYTTAERLLKYGIFSNIWQNGNGMPVDILPRVAVTSPLQNTTTTA